MQACKVYDGDGTSYRQPLMPTPGTNTRLRHRLFIDSRDADPNLTSFSFTVDLEAAGAPRFERVEKVELKALAFPKTSDPYVIMDVKQLNDDRLVSRIKRPIDPLPCVILMPERFHFPSVNSHP